MSALAVLFYMALSLHIFILNFAFVPYWNLVDFQMRTEVSWGHFAKLLNEFGGSVRVRLFVTPWTAADQASLSLTVSRSLPKCISIESVMPSSYLIGCVSTFYEQCDTLFPLSYCWILVPWPGIEPVPPAAEARSLNHWTARKVCRLPQWKKGWVDES